MKSDIRKDSIVEKKGDNSTAMIWLLFLCMFFATANTLLFKVTLNAFSSPKTNYGFFISQFTTMMYTFQAVVVSIVLMIRDFNSFRTMFVQTPAIVFVYMGLSDSAGATLGAIAGVNCPGELQTVLNQMVIPITMMGASVFLNAHFERFQIWGSAFIVLGAVVASSDYILNGGSSKSATDGGGAAGDAVDSSMVSAAIMLYFCSIVPCALANIYKEGVMKERDMNEVYTSTMVAFWQIWFGFLYLPLLTLPQLGGLSYHEMTMQFSDGFTCFMGTNPNDPEGDCSNAAKLLITYIIINFGYNLLMLAVTKRGSAVMLVIAQALSLPVTNIAFTLKIFMGDTAEPLTVVDLLGLVLVCIGFLVYSGFGFASNFMVAQGPPGQMAYVHFEDVSEVIISTELATKPEQLISFLVNATMQQQDIQITQQQRSRSQTLDPLYGNNNSNGAPIADSGVEMLAGLDMSLPQRDGHISYGAMNSAMDVNGGEDDALLPDTAVSTGIAGTAGSSTELNASIAALRVLTKAQRLLHDRIGELREQERQQQQAGLAASRAVRTGPDAGATSPVSAAV
mmetsp:Transcript_50508/g.99771  ORF Transcript_50508/g.99771 Transcript_50508/m.99771 type:complete len:566 (+) Transcript_50508:85-1782(+)